MQNLIILNQLFDIFLPFSFCSALKKLCGIHIDNSALLIAVSTEAHIPGRFHYSWVTPEWLMA